MGFTPPYLEVRKITGGWSIFPPDYTTTDDLTISANGTDTYDKIVLNGAGTLELYTQTGYGFRFYSGAVLTGQHIYVAGDNHLKISCEVADKDIFLSPAGTGVIKFGTYTAGAATDSTGYITIKDSAGNTRKLMVQA